MTAIAVTAAQVGRVRPEDDEVIDMVVAEAVTAGQAIYQTTAAKAGVADANASGKQQFRGIALMTRAAGDPRPIPVLKRGMVWGFGVSALNGDAPLYLSDTAGALDDGAGTMTVICGRVTALTNGVKVAYIDADWTRIWS